jgi:hypothetical protein
LNKNKGQFSIIAALLVAVVLIGTVIITYSTIRNSPIQGEPQVLSAIDETNLALKQILGFTIGYYGSVLQVTGNSTYAKTLATNYLHSGLENIANMHPEWGTSFNVSRADMSTYWFTNTSYSTGNLAVNYSLTGLGMYGITYETSCRLMVYVENTTSSTQTQLIVTKDGDEPLINLGKQNFKFYRYVYADSKWELVNPSTEPVAFANGTYLIDIPTGVDPYSYVIQVEDPRGIIVVASSFSHYTCTLTWNPESTETKYAVAGSALQILNAPDGSYATIARQANCQVTGYQGGTTTIKEVYFNIVYYGSVSGTLEWYYQLDGGTWNKIEDLPEGGSAVAPLTRTYSATSLRASWTWNNLNTTYIRFKNNGDNSSENSYVDAIYVTVVVQTIDVYSTLQDANIVVELMQNGTMRWLGQSLTLTTQAKPVPPIPVKAIRVNQTINGVNSEVPFQIEDWTSEYRIPLGLTDNASVFSSRTMLVFLANSKVSKTTIWWDGNDTANQTPYAYINRYFTGDDPDNGVLTNGVLRLQFSSGFTVTSRVGSTSCTATFMRINNEASEYGSSLAYAIYDGIVRDVIHQEAEWSDGASNCPNVYAHIVLTLPANATYYTYQLRLMFVQSQQKRNITDLCPIKLTASIGSQQTENGTASGYPIVASTTGSFYNLSASSWAHHWSQFISGTRGIGIMFRDSANQQLYYFDAIAKSKTGALKVSTASGRTIELLPVTLAPANFTNALDIAWHGAVVTFDGTTPIYTEAGGQKTGLWIITEYPPKITVTTES